MPRHRSTWKIPAHLPPAPSHEYVVHRPDLVGQEFGRVRIVDGTTIYGAGRDARRAVTECKDCGLRRWAFVDLLARGKTKGCRECSYAVKRVASPCKRLRQRLAAAKDRCNNPRNASFRNYGGRGIRFEFETITLAARWVLEHLGPPAEWARLDRINNDGNYAPGNLRWVTVAQNNQNMRRSVLREDWRQAQWPYCRGAVIELLRRGLTREQIIQRAVEFARGASSAAATIRERLKTMGVL